MSTGNALATENTAGNADNPMVGSAYVRKAVEPYGRIPVLLIECTRLRPISRLIAIWVLSKPRGWVVRPPVLQWALGISEKQWLSARREMMAAGIFFHKKVRRSDGTWRWESKLDITPLRNATPPLAARGESTHGRTANIKTRDIEVDDRNGKPSFDEIPFEDVEQKTEAHCTSVQSAISLPPQNLSCAPKHDQIRSKSDIDELKKLHIGYVFEALGISWDEDGIYLYGDTHHRARQAEDGHWLWFKVDGAGDEAGSGSAIDLLMVEGGYTQAQAINVLRGIYFEVMAELKSEGE